MFFTGPDGNWVEMPVAGLSGTPGAGVLTTRVPYNAVKGPIRVANAGGVAASATNFYPLPTVSNYMPTSGGAGLDLSTFGANLGGANSHIRFSNGVEVYNGTPLASNQLKIEIPANAASGPLTLITDGGSVTLSPNFTFAHLCPLKADNTCAAANDGGAIEINQGLPDDMYPLVAGKPTLVRVYLGSDTPQANVRADSSTLFITGPNGTVVRGASPPRHIFNNTVRAFSEQANLNFFLDGSEIPTSGDYTFGVIINSGSNPAVYHANVAKPVENTRDLRLVISEWGNGQPANYSQVVAEHQSIYRAIAAMGRVFPVRGGTGFLPDCPSCGVGYHFDLSMPVIPTQFYTGTPAAPQVMCDNMGGFNYVRQVDEDMLYWWNRLAEGASFRFHDTIGFVPWRHNPQRGLGCAEMGTPGALQHGNLQGVGGAGDNTTGAVLSQELAHNFGLVPNSSATSNGSAHSINEYILAPDGATRETRGFNLSTRTAIAEPHTVMEGSCCTGIESNDSVLFEPADFAPLMSSIRSLVSSGSGLALELSPAGVAVSATERVFNLVGTLDLSGTVQRFESFLLPAGATVTPLSSGPYYLVFQDASGVLLAADGFPVSFTLSHGDTGDTASFSVSRPMPANTARVQIRQNQTALITFTLSSNAPTVTITAPLSGTFGAAENVTTTWAAGDVDGDSLTFIVLYSRDDGATWQPLAAGLRGDSFTWNTARAGGTAVGSFSRLKVIASDGFNTAEAISNRFTVAGKPPVATILAPSANARYVEGRIVTLQGAGEDTEDGTLPPSALN